MEYYPPGTSNRSVSFRQPNVQDLVNRYNAMNAPKDQTPNNSNAMEQQPILESAGDLLQRHPRVAVTPSMLYAYAHLRGAKSQHVDPLHHALYPASRRNTFPHRMWIPPILKSSSIEELPRGATFFWDPVIPNMHPIGGPPAQDAAPKSNRPIYDHPALSFDEYMRLNPTSVGRNHYKGDMVYANFGYFLVDGKWVDPESEGALFDAYIGRSNDSNPELPHLNRSRDSGSYVMKQEEQDEFYREFVEDVTDEIDGEGDPRVYRITPAIFARWATGAVEGEKFEETVMEPQAKIPTPPTSTRGDGIRRLPRPINQYDIETGSVLSGVYKAERSPSLLQSPRRVDVIRKPVYFSYSYPQAQIDLDKEAFGERGGDRGSQDSLVSSVASTPEVFSSERAWKSLGTPGDLKSGENEYEKEGGRLCRLRQQANLALVANLQDNDGVNAAVESRVNLGREVFFLKKRLAETAAAGTFFFSFQQDDILSDALTEESNTTPPPVRRRSQYKRYLEEGIKNEQIAINRAKKTDERLQDDLQMCLDDIHELRATKKQLLAALGVEDTSQIPGLLPQVVKPLRGIEHYLGDGLQPK